MWHKNYVEIFVEKHDAGERTDKYTQCLSVIVVSVSLFVPQSQDFQQRCQAVTNWPSPSSWLQDYGPH